MRILSRHLLVPAASLLLALSAHTQCGARWQPGSPYPGVDGTANTACLYGNPPRAVVAGNFRVAGYLRTDGIAAWDPVNGTWSAFGSGIDGFTTDALTLPNGDLVIAGQFVGVSGVAANNIARWDGASWSPLGSGTDGWILALDVLPNGDLVASGEFTTAGGQPAQNIARWDGSSWSTIGSGVGGEIRSLLVTSTGDVIAGGQSLEVGTGPTGAVRWNGTAWSNVGPSFAEVRCLAELPNGTLVCGTTSNGVQAFDGVMWNPLGTLTWFPSVKALLATSGGTLLAANEERVAALEGSDWTELGELSGCQDIVELPDGRLLAARFGSGVSVWNGSEWSGVGSGTNGRVLMFAEGADGTIVASGGFTAVETTAAAWIASWDGSAWSALGTGLTGPATAIAAMPNGDVIAAGAFFASGGTPPGPILRWDGTAWSSMNNGLLGGLANALVVDDDGELFLGTNSAGATSALYHWNGSSWVAVGALQGQITTMAANPGGGLVIAGDFLLPGQTTSSGVAIGNGSIWTGLAGGGATFHDIDFLPNGDLVVCGTDLSQSNIAGNTISRWDGSSWNALGAGLSDTTYAVEITPGGDLIVGGMFTQAGTGNAAGIARWDGTAWSPFGDGVQFGGVFDLQTLPNGEVLVGGDFVLANDRPNAYLARLASDCPATGTPLGTGCLGPANVPLSVTGLPWLGGALEATAAGIPAGALAIGAYGNNTASLPLASILPVGVPSCLLLVAPELLQVAVPAGGTATTSLAMPNVAALVGATFHHQMVLLDFTSGSLTSMSASDAISATVGRF